MDNKIPAKIWTGFGPHPYLNIDNWYNRILIVLHKLIVNEIKRRAIGDIWLDKPGTLEERIYVWTKNGWRRKP